MRHSAPHEHWSGAHPAGEWRPGSGLSRPWSWNQPGGFTRGARWFPVVFSQLIQLPVVVWALFGWHGWVQSVIAVLAFLSSYLLLWLVWQPGPALLCVAVLTVPAIILGDGPPLAAVPLAFAVVGATVRGARAWVWSTVGVGVIAAIAYATLVTERPFSVVRPLLVMLVLSLLVGLGEVIRNRRERFAEYRVAQQRHRQSEAERERLRIARELHDVLAHSLSSINVQAGMGLHLIDDQPAKAAEALANIKETSKTALDEVRGVLGFLRSGTGEGAPLVPEPELARLPALVESVAGLGVAVALEGGLSPTASLLEQRAVYRIVQEALTNITRHSNATHATVRLESSVGLDTVTVVDDGTTEHPEDELAEGRGLLGMRERAQLLGGTVEVGWQAGGGFAVVARLPHADGARP
ncbi:sensor histidine kinase [Luethyella okanaganae]|uniref:histidine kinase n=1 Tax=Luethyella okanaganae TaxID=69372 RepID=A0ABW1VE41_9MICO